MNLRSIFLPACLALFACSSETTIQGSGGAGSGGVSGGGGSPTGGGAGSGATGGTAGGGADASVGGTAGSGATGGAGGTDAGPDCDAGPVPCGAEVVTKAGTPFGLVVAGSNVVVSNNAAAGTLYSCATSGCASPTPLPGSFASPKRLAYRTSDSTLVWANNAAGTAGSVMSCLLPACAQQKTLQDLLNAPEHVAVSDTHVFFSDADKQLWRCDSSCSVIQSTATAIAGLAYVQSTGRIYWSAPDTQSSGQIKSCVAATCSPSTTPDDLATGLPFVGAIAKNPSEGTMFFVHDLAKSALKACPMSGCASSATDLTTKTALISPISLATDGASVYVLEKSATVRRCNANGCLATDPDYWVQAAATGGTIALDGEYVYWTVPSTGYVLRKKKN